MTDVSRLRTFRGIRRHPAWPTLVLFVAVFLQVASVAFVVVVPVLCFLAVLKGLTRAFASLSDHDLMVGILSVVMAFVLSWFVSRLLDRVFPG